MKHRTPPQFSTAAACLQERAVTDRSNAQKRKLAPSVIIRALTRAAAGTALAQPLEPIY